MGFPQGQLILIDSQMRFCSDESLRPTLNVDVANSPIVGAFPVSTTSEPAKQVGIASIDLTCRHTCSSGGRRSCRRRLPDFRMPHLALSCATLGRSAGGGEHMGLRQRVQRLTHRLRPNGTACPCGVTSWLDGWGRILEAAAAAIRADRDIPTDEDDRLPRCRHCGWLVPRPTVVDQEPHCPHAPLLQSDSRSTMRAGLRP